MRLFRTLENELQKPGFKFKPAKVNLEDQESFNVGGRYEKKKFNLTKPVTWSFEAVGKDGILERLRLTYLEDSQSTEKENTPFLNEFVTKTQESEPSVPHVKLVIERGIPDNKGGLSLPNYMKGLSNYTLRFLGKSHEQKLATKERSKGHTDFTREDLQKIRAILSHLKRAGEEILPLPDQEPAPEQETPEAKTGFLSRLLARLSKKAAQTPEQTKNPEIEHAKTARAHILSFLKQFG